jgi:hypothetical protein
MTKSESLLGAIDTSSIMENVTKLFPGTYFRPRQYSSGELELEFSTGQTEEYLFYLWLWPQISLIIGARLRSNPDCYFWYESTDRITRDDTDWEKQVKESIVDTIEKLVKYPTRIIQRDGLFSSSFVCEYFDGSWKTMSKTSAIKLFGLCIPKIQGRVKVYM